MKSDVKRWDIWDNFLRYELGEAIIQPSVNLSVTYMDSWQGLEKTLADNSIQRPEVVAESTKRGKRNESPINARRYNDFLHSIKNNPPQSAYSKRILLMKYFPRFAPGGNQPLSDEYSDGAIEKVYSKIKKQAEKTVRNHSNNL